MKTLNAPDTISGKAGRAYRGACPGPGRGLGACKCAAYYDDRPGRPSDLRRNGRRRHH
nr:MAG TPA: hypothetical protein [Caudoviricetes sp.]